MTVVIILFATFKAEQQSAAFYLLKSTYLINTPTICRVIKLF